MILNLTQNRREKKIFVVKIRDELIQGFRDDRNYGFAPKDRNSRFTLRRIVLLLNASHTKNLEKKQK